MALFSSEKVSNSLPALESCLIVPNLYFIKMMTHCTQSPLLTLVLLITDSFCLVESNKWSQHLWNYFFKSPSITREMKHRFLTLERNAAAWYHACSLLKESWRTPLLFFFFLNSHNFNEDNLKFPIVNQHLAKLCLRSCIWSCCVSDEFRPMCLLVEGKHVWHLLLTLSRLPGCLFSDRDG